MDLQAKTNPCWRRIVLSTHLIVTLASIGYTFSRPAIAFITQQEPGGGIIAVSLLTTGFLVARSLASPLAGLVGDRSARARETLMRATLLFAGLTLLAMYLTPTPLALLALMSLWGFLSGLIWPTLQYAVSRVGGTTQLGVYFALGGLGMSLGYLLYGTLEVSDEEAIGASSLLLLASGLLSLSLYRNTASCLAPPGNEGHGVTSGKSRGSPGWIGGIRGALTPLALWVLASALLMGAARGLLGEFLYVYLSQVHGVGKQMLGGVLSASQLASVAASLVAGILAERLGLSRVLALVLASNGLALIALSLHSPGLTLLSTSLILAHFAVSASLPLTRTVAVSGDPAYAGTIIGLSNTLSNVGGALAPLVAAVVYTLLREAGPWGPLEARGLVFALVGLASLALAFTRPARG